MLLNCYFKRINFRDTMFCTLRVKVILFSESFQHDNIKPSNLLEIVKI